MLQIGNKPIDTMYVGGKLVQQAYMGSKKVYPLHGVIPKAIKDSMVLWYDLKRQGATNESMAENPILKDLSGNGHDITCYNFAWSGMSGVGGYVYDYSTFRIYQERATLEVNSTSVRVLSVISTNAFIESKVSSLPVGTTIQQHKIKVTGLDAIGIPNTNLKVRLGVEPSDNDVLITKDGVYDIPLHKIDDNFNYAMSINRPLEECNVLIELLPLYPNALVSDGVDDYYQTLPTYPKEVGTCFLTAQSLEEDSTSVIFYMSRADEESGDISPWRGTTVGVGNKNRIMLRGVDGEGKEISKLSSPDSDLSGKGTIVFTWNNNIPLMVGRINDERVELGLEQPHTKYSLATDFNGGNIRKKFAFYSFLLFDRDLTEQEIEWVKKNLVEGNDDDADWYGVEFYTTSDNPDCVRIGNPELHKTLPVHSQMKGCLLADDGTVNKYLNESDWTSETLDGSQGQVMVEVPKTAYWRFETDGNIRRVKFSTKPLPGFKPTPQGYVSAYEASVQRSANKLSSVVNTDADYRGGNNNAGWDGTYRSLLGMPATQISRTNFRNYARNRKADSTEWNLMTYDMQKLLYWLFVVEYGTLNSQKAFNADKDANGYAQGGLGAGLTNLNGTKWNALNGYYPVIKCGYTNILGNGTGQIPYTMPSEYEASGAANYAGEYDAEAAYTDGQFVSQGEELYECIADAAAGTALTDTTYFKKVTRTVTYVPRYRGVENPFGHLWQWTDGINVRISPTTDNGGDNLSKVFVCSDPAQFKDDGYDNYTYVGDEARTESYVKEVIFGEGGEIMPKVVGDGASSTKYFCDYHYTNIPATETLRGVLFGGPAHLGATAGFAAANSNNAPSHATAALGSRLCFIPE